jgi:hypothetical protein
MELTVKTKKLQTPRRCLIALALGTFLPSSASLGQEALQLFHKMQTALGGADKIASVRDYEQTVHADAWDYGGTPMGVVRKRVRFVRPSYLRIDQVGQRDTYVLYFDGTSGWEILPDRTVADLKGGELTFAQNYLNGFDLNVWLADRDPRYLIGTPGPNVITIAAKDNSFPPSEITLDPVTFLPMKATGTSHADPDDHVSDETRLEEWHVVEGVKFPGVITKLHNGKKLAEITVEQTKVNGGLKVGDLAIKPPDLKPVMSQP